MWGASHISVDFFLCDPFFENEPHRDPFRPDAPNRKVVDASADRELSDVAAREDARRDCKPVEGHGVSAGKVGAVLECGRRFRGGELGRDPSHEIVRQTSAASVSQRQEISHDTAPPL
ncbi:hypothetical protein SDC9_212412 [bioreactor metagenome]|uniref:Uncharacterized protein n=1 Tax=bioreactor metagenome TaxID=1076179 RepID=A0A645JMN1_9ZZZZ